MTKLQIGLIVTLGIIFQILLTVFVTALTFDTLDNSKNNDTNQTCVDSIPCLSTDHDITISGSSDDLLTENTNSIFPTSGVITIGKTNVSSWDNEPRPDKMTIDYNTCDSIPLLGDYARSIKYVCDNSDGVVLVNLTELKYKVLTFEDGQILNPSIDLPIVTSGNSSGGSLG